MSSSNVERMAFTTFEIVKDSEFKFTAKTYFYGTEIPSRETEKSDQETVRTAWLEKYLELNSMCLNGYEITERRVVLLMKSLGTTHQIFYLGRCK